MHIAQQHKIAIKHLVVKQVQVLHKLIYLINIYETMWFIDTLRTRVKQWTDKAIEVTSQAWNFVEEKWWQLLEKIPWGKNIWDKASHLAEDAVNRVWKEWKWLVESGEKFVDAHMKKSDEAPKTEEK